MLGKIESNHYWNAFGLKKPRENSSSHIVLEMNFPLEGIDRRVGGVFVKDNKAHVFVCHRGKIGGGRPGIGKTLFKNNFHSDRWVAVRDGGKETDVALIDRVSSPRLAFQIRNFIAEIDRIKKLATENTENLTPESNLDFTPEFTGEKHFELYRYVASKCDHGFVVNELAAFLRAQGLRVGNDKNRDLFSADSSGNISAIYEVKTDLSLYDLYTGVGQLLLNSCDLESKPSLILVLPKKISTFLKSKLRKIGIIVLIYRMNEMKVTFENIEK